MTNNQTKYRIKTLTGFLGGKTYVVQKRTWHVWWNQPWEYVDYETCVRVIARLQENKND